MRLHVARPAARCRLRRRRACCGSAVARPSVREGWSPPSRVQARSRFPALWARSGPRTTSRASISSQGTSAGLRRRRVGRRARQRGLRPDRFHPRAARRGAAPRRFPAPIGSRSIHRRRSQHVRPGRRDEGDAARDRGGVRARQRAAARVSQSRRDRRPDAPSQRG